MRGYGSQRTLLGRTPVRTFPRKSDEVAGLASKIYGWSLGMANPSLISNELCIKSCSYPVYNIFSYQKIKQCTLMDTSPSPLPFKSMTKCPLILRVPSFGFISIKAVPASNSVNAYIFTAPEYSIKFEKNILWNNSIRKMHEKCSPIVIITMLIWSHIQRETEHKFRLDIANRYIFTLSAYIWKEKEVNITTSFSQHQGSLLLGFYF